jgi:hypothetical protein
MPESQEGSNSILVRERGRDGHEIAEGSIIIIRHMTK